MLGCTVDCSAFFLPINQAEVIQRCKCKAQFTVWCSQSQRLNIFVHFLKKAASSKIDHFTNCIRGKIADGSLHLSSLSINFILSMIYARHFQKAVSITVTLTASPSSSEKMKKVNKLQYLLPLGKAADLPIKSK